MGLTVEERIVAGSDADALVVHHLVLRGSLRAIGRHLGALVRARFGAGPPAAGAAAAEREHLRSSTAYAPGPADGPRVTRTLQHAGPLGHPRHGAASAARPYVLELHPDEGHPSLAVCAFELEDAALDGVNAAGLVVVAAPDLAAPRDRGLAALPAVRHLLDRCASAGEARDALLGGALYVAARPARWLVADAAGDAYLVEVAGGHWQAQVVDADGEWHAPADGADEGALRTLWHGAYDAAARRLTARFYVGAGDWRRGEAPEVAFQLA
jgi:hypothetical protein